MSGKRIQDFFISLQKKLEMDCDDIDLPEENLNKETEKPILRHEQNIQNRKQTLANPFLRDFFQRLRTNHKSKKHWFNKK